MQTRREAIKMIMAVWSGMAAGMIPVKAGIRLAYAGTKEVVLPKGTPMHSLVNRDPADLDTRNLEITPLNEFDTMGLTNHPVSVATWRLEVSGVVERPLKLKYADVLKMEAFEKELLLICPGFFAYKGRWKGIRLSTLLGNAGLQKGASRLVVHGPEDPYRKSEGFPLKEVSQERLLLAYKVNGVTLPERHGFPMRLVAQGHYGSRWVKFVERIEVM